MTHKVLMIAFMIHFFRFLFYFTYLNKQNHAKSFPQLYGLPLIILITSLRHTYIHKHKTNAHMQTLKTSLQPHSVRGHQPAPKGNMPCLTAFCSLTPGPGSNCETRCRRAKLISCMPFRETTHKHS